MLREAELFTMAEEMLVEVLSRIRDADLDIELPRVVGVTGPEGGSLRAVVELHLRDEAAVPDALAGRRPRAEALPDPAAFDAAKERQALVRSRAAAATAAAAAVSDAVVVGDDGRAAAPGDALVRLTIVRSLVAHYVAAYLGSTACPLPEELARPLWELTAPLADHWRAEGLFRPALPIPDLASWRDVFLRTAGHEPHPLGH